MARRANRRGADRDKDLVGFLVGDVHYAIDIRRVREIIRPLVTVELPHAPSTVVGVADHRGEVVPVVDVRRRFGMAPLENRNARVKWILVGVKERTVGLAVDSITEVFASAEDHARVVPNIGDQERGRGIVAVFGHRGSLVFVLNIDLLASPTADLDLATFDRTAWERAASRMSAL